MSVRSATGGSIRRRVARTLTLPVAAVLLLLAVVTVIEAGGYRRAAASARAVTLALAVQDLVQELQTERGLAAGLLGGNAGFRAELPAARQRVDGQRARLQRLATGAGGAAGVRVTSAIRDLDGLAGVRAGTDSGAVGRQPAFAYYTERLAGLAGLDVGLDSAADPALRRGTAALQALGDAKESMAQERAFLNGVFSAGGFRGDEFLQFVTMRAAKDAALTTFVRYASATQRTAADYVFGTGAGRVAGYFEQVALGAGDGRSLVVNPQSWWSALTTVLDDMLRLEQHIGSVIRARAAVLRDQAARRMAALGLVVLLCFAGSVYLAVVASRSIARPLATLAAEADRLALDRLPDAVRRASAGDDDVALPPVHAPPGASEEVRSVAAALDRVQATAYALATEQAVLRRGTTESLADLGRRNQNLLRRQLGFITRLEREESDPAGLANLFELDHLATRMRRNAESLLVLVGAATPRQWSEPLPVADVIRAAVAEVEEYRRVTLRRVDETMLAGAVVNGIAHMLAELVENGLSFSAPDVDVEIQGRLIGDRYLIAIVDQGVGMTDEDLDDANRRLRGEGDFLVAPARFLGHHVVGRLARDLGIDVRLTPSPVTGTTARVFLPAAVLARPRPVPAPAATPPDWPAPADEWVSELDLAASGVSAPSTEIVEMRETSVTTPDGRLRPATVEYVVAPPVPMLPLQRTGADGPAGARTANGLPRRPPPGAPRTVRTTPPHRGPAGRGGQHTRRGALPADRTDQRRAPGRHPGPTGKAPMSVETSADRHQFNWLLGNFVQHTDGVRDAVAVSSDGLLIAGSDGLSRADADHLAAIVSSLASVARSAARRYDFDGLKLIMIEMRRGFLVVSVMAGGSCLGVVAGGDSDIGLVGYEISRLAERFGALLTPARISESRQHLRR